MPQQAARPCSKRPCTGLVRDGECSKCGSQRRDKDRAHDEGRGTAHQRGYGATWRRVRLMQLSREPLCEDCKAQGIVNAASEVHHLQKKREGGSDSFENLLSLCKSCHSKRTAQGE